MRSDIDQLMANRSLEAIFVVGGEQPNTYRAYLSNGVDIHGGMTIKKRGSDPVMITGSMEIEEASKSGLQVITFYDLGWAQMIREAEGDPAKASIALWGHLLEKFAIPPGRIGIYGVGELNVWIERIRALSDRYPNYQFVGETGMTLFDEAFVTKDAEEIKIIREVADKTSAVMAEAWDFISGHKADGETVVKADGTPLTIGDVKRHIRHALMDRGLEDTDMIFAQGRDGAFPHSRGEDSEALQLGKPIVFDFFPREMGGGYFHDCTRTWCIGYAPEPVQELYDTVMESFKIAVDTYAEPGQPCHTLQDAVHEYFESKGHPTQHSKPGTTEGLVHGLGHGVGMNIHERPSISHLMKKDIFQKGNFITIEPGLYYPDKGMGVRIEDSFLIDDSGELVSLSSFHKQLVLPLKGS